MGYCNEARRLQLQQEFREGKRLVSPQPVSGHLVHKKSDTAMVGAGTLTLMDAVSLLDIPRSKVDTATASRADIATLESDEMSTPRGTSCYTLSGALSVAFES